MSSDTAIVVENLGKRYHIGVAQKRPATAAEAVRRAFTSPFRYLETYVRRLRTTNHEPGTDEPDILWALRNVSFEVKQGEVLGIIGRNGAGKSTLLKILSRITDPTEGRATIRGRVNSLLEVGTGFNPDLTGRENIYLNAALHGLKRREIAGRLDEIIAFSEVEKFIDTPVKFYSSGMYTRLAFAVAAHLEPEVLIVDEVLAVGDAAFQKKCLGKMGEVARGGRTVLFVSHNISSVRELCGSAVLMDKGQMIDCGETSRVVNAYLRQGGGHHYAPAERSRPDAEVLIRRVLLTDRDGKQRDNYECEEDVHVRASCTVRKAIPGLYGFLGVTRDNGTIVLASDSFDEPPNVLDAVGLGEHVLHIVIPRRSLAPGTYELFLNVTSEHSSRSFWVDSVAGVRFELQDSFSARGNRRVGYFSTLLRWSIDDEAS
jgi:lipopolysaccharide transport system ATP-binding protein